MPTIPMFSVYDGEKLDRPQTGIKFVPSEKHRKKISALQFVFYEVAGFAYLGVCERFNNGRSIGAYTSNSSELSIQFPGMNVGEFSAVHFGQYDNRTSPKSQPVFFHEVCYVMKKHGFVPAAA